CQSYDSSLSAQFF
nr:immunoglobulin light chain junction region [Macaca mulatta]MPN65255.1 immunoglobulin light chain junction region [Macaca mulatta]MPN65357.1 immunoglobulin light chain junction region [Macaca mulatta]MPN65380.1 immunoglobulin light chain junction region [Macaca mulatta]MPN65381.1 immunoglobulin light chain junction region [Macaca mulatta]